MAAAGPLLDSFWQSLLTIVFFYAFMGLTWNLMMSAGLLSLGHGLFLGLGAYATAVFTATGGLSPWISILIGAAISAVAGSAIAWIGGRFSVRGVQFALLTIAFAELARVLFDNWDFVGSTGGFFLKAINPRRQPAAPDAARRHAILLPGFCADNGRGVFPDPRLDGLAVGLPLARH